MSEKVIQKMITALIENRPSLTRDRIREVFNHAVQSNSQVKG